MGRKELARQREATAGRIHAIREAIADRVAEIERLQDKRSAKKARDPKDVEREALLKRQIAELHDSIQAQKRLLDRKRTRLQKARKNLKRIRRKLRNLASPKVIDLGSELSFRSMASQPYVAGSIGHYTAGPVDDDDAEAIQLWRQYHGAHLAQGWSGIGYHVGLTRDGTIVLLRPMRYVGAHTGGANTGQIGFVCHGTLGDTWTRAQKRAFRKALKKYGLKNKPVKVHRDFMATSCPGDFEGGYRSRGR